MGRPIPIRRYGESDALLSNTVREGLGLITYSPKPSFEFRKPRTAKRFERRGVVNIGTHLGHRVGGAGVPLGPAAVAEAAGELRVQSREAPERPYVPHEKKMTFRMKLLLPVRT